MKNISIFVRGTAVFAVGFFIFNAAIAFAASANITELVFTTAQQSIPAGAPSAVISIQTQNASGGSEQIDETNDLYLTSTSPTGQFSSSLTNWQPVTQITMSKNTANKNFYYEDANAGDDTITARIVGRTTGLTFSASQDIDITNGDNTTGDQTDEIATTTDNTTDDSTATTTATTTNTVIEYVSTHASPADLSDWQENPTFAISAGRERTTYIGVPIEFLAQYSVPSNFPEAPQIFNWSFGDGTSASGKNVTHTYKYPGDYVVVLNSTDNGTDAVARTAVSVLVPDISMSALTDGDVQIANAGDTEINLGLWTLVATSSTFIFPEDTIVAAGKTIILSDADTKIQTHLGGSVSLDNPTGGQVASAIFSGTIFPSISTSTAMLSLNDIVERNLGMTPQAAEAVVALIKQYKNAAAGNTQSQDSPVAFNKSSPKNNAQASTTTVENISQSATVMQAVQASSSKGFWAKLVGIPASGIRSLARLFYNL